MSPIEYIAFLLIILLLARLFLKFRLWQKSSKSASQSKFRQKKIQCLLDDLGSLLSNKQIPLQQGEQAANDVLSQLHEMNINGDLDELIADTEQYVKTGVLKNNDKTQRLRLLFSSAAWMRVIHHFGQMLKIQVGVDLRGGDVGVAKHFLHGTQVAR